MGDSDNVLPLGRSSREQAGEPAPTAADTGRAIMKLLQQALDVAQRNEERAKALAQQFGDELKVAERQVQELESRLRHYQDRAEAAEQWLVRIGNEIQQQIIEQRSADHVSERLTRR